MSEDTSSVRKYWIDSDMACGCHICGCSFMKHFRGYEFEIYDRVIDVPNPNPEQAPIVADARLLTSVFICDECYAKKTEPVR
jgi:hypothetical protein